MLLREIEISAGVAPTRSFLLREAIEVVITWCDRNPEKKLVKISWLFTLRAKHLAMALRYILGQLPEE